MSRNLVFVVCVLLSAASICDAQQMIVSPDRATGVYDVGDAVRWRAEWKGDGPAPSGARYTLKSGGLKEAGQGELKFEGNVATVESKFDAPSTMLLEVQWGPSDKPSRAFGGAVAAPQKITPAAAEPDDFDAFWKAKLDELAKVPPNPQLTAGESNRGGVDYWKITLDNIRGTHVNGQVARPTKGEKFPALLILQWAGVYPLQKGWVADRAADGWLALNVLPHDLPIDNPEQFYKYQYNGPLKNYWMIGNEDKDTSYYLRMYLSCVRAMEYLKSRPDWDGKTLVVMGTSQGGQQALALAGLQPDAGITAALPFLPAACDMLASEVGRASGFPNWYAQTWGGRDAKKVHESSKHYDPVNFARRIKCPVLTGLGLKDDLAPPSSVLAAANVITSPKEVIILPTAGHQDENGSQKPYNDRAYGAWLPALREGRAPPIAAGITAAVSAPTSRPVASFGPTPEERAASAEDHRRMLELLKIDKLRPGPSGNPNAPNAANSDESKATPYPNLPDPLVLNNGERVTTPQVWRDQRRAEIVEAFDREIYGRMPKDVPTVKWEVVSTREEMQNGVPVVTKQLIGHADNSACPSITVDIRLNLTTPAKASGPVPVVMEFGFGALRGPRPGGPSSQPSGPTWQQQVLDRGWGYAILVPASIQADNGAGLTKGIIGLANKGQPRKPDDWGSLRAWGWGASRAIDYFETDKAVDAKRVAIEGLSRYGKAALVAMAYEPRLAIGFIGSSGAGGAKLLRRNFGEQVENLASSAEYHWFAGNFIKYAGPLTPGDLPVDAHELIALCAPRPVFISVGSPTVEGNWIDGRGMFLAAVGAGPVYRLLGKRDLGMTEFPPMETAVVEGDLAFRQHSGGHTTGPNWPTFLAYAERYFGKEKPKVSRADEPEDRNGDPLWRAKHEELVARAKQGNIDLYFLGDSITRRWAANQPASWQRHFGGWRAANFGAGGDHTQNVLYRIENGELDGLHPKVIVLLIGTNNVGAEPIAGDDAPLVEDVTNGVRAILKSIARRAPEAKVLLTGITPRNTNGSTALMPTIGRINQRLASLADGQHIRFLDLTDRMADADGKPREGVTDDGLHLTHAGYEIWAEAMKPTLIEWLGQPAASN